MNDEKLCDILYEALKESCSFLRRNCPATIEDEDYDVLPFVVGGAQDPDGEKYVNYFLMKACKKLEERE